MHIKIVTCNVALLFVSDDTADVQADIFSNILLKASQTDSFTAQFENNEILLDAGLDFQSLIVLNCET